MTDFARPLFPSRLCGPGNGTAIVMAVLDGVGDLATADHDWQTPLEVAVTPHLDALVRRGTLGTLSPAGVGITVGSVSGHLALWGYDPLRTTLGRGTVDGLGVGVDVCEGDVLLRGNFSTVREDGVILDRRAGRPSDTEGARLCALLAMKIREIMGVEVKIHPIRGHRFSLCMRGQGLSSEITDTDPQTIGTAPLTSHGLFQDAEQTAEIVNLFAQRAAEVLADSGSVANSVLLRGAEGMPKIASFSAHFSLRSLALASYPSYRGIARACGMAVGDPKDIEEAMKMAADALVAGQHDFLYVHFKDCDRAGEDGDFDAKVRAIEEFDRALPALVDNLPPGTVLAVTADHATPVALRKHGWQEVPLLLVSPWSGKPDEGARFTEVHAGAGSLGHLRSVDLMPLLLAHTQRLRKVDGDGV